jgi:hypothetical protein
MVNIQTAPPEGFNNPDWQLHKGNKNHVRFLSKCVEAFWLIYEGQQLTGEAFFQQQWLAIRLEVTVRHAQNVIAELKSRKLIEVDRRDQNYYRVVEFFSKSPGQWVEMARQKAKAAIAKLFPNLASQKASSGEKQPGQSSQAKKPKIERSFKAAKTQPATTQAPVQQAPVQLSEQEQADIERRGKEVLAKMMAEQQAQYQASKALLDPELKKTVEQIAERLIQATVKTPIRDAFAFMDKLRAKLKEYDLVAPFWLLEEIANDWAKKQGQGWKALVSSVTNIPFLS